MVYTIIHATCKSETILLLTSRQSLVTHSATSFLSHHHTQRYKLLDADATWDGALKKGVQEFQNRSYNLFTCNCHSFVANNLNRLFYAGHDKWNVVSLAALMFLRGRWVSAAAAAKTLVPFAVVLAVGAFLGGTTFLLGLLAFAAAMTGWFLVGTYCIKGLVEL